MDDIFKEKEFNASSLEKQMSIGSITEKEKFIAAKQILFGLGFLYVLTVLAYLFKPADGGRLLDICTTTFPPLATLILASYFRDKVH